MKSMSVGINHINQDSEGNTVRVLELELPVAFALIVRYLIFF